MNKFWCSFNCPLKNLGNELKEQVENNLDICLCRCNVVIDRIYHVGEEKFVSVIVYDKE